MPNVIFYLSQASTNPNAFVLNVMLPFLLIFVIIWGMLRMIKIFGADATANKINLVIAFVITVFASFTDAWGVIVGLAAGTGQFAYIMFFVVFVLGTIFWAIGRSRGIYMEHGVGGGTHLNDIKKISKELSKLYNKYREAEYAGNQGKMKVIGDDIRKLEERKKFLYELEQNKR